MVAANPSFGASGFGIGGYGNQPVESQPLGYYLNLLTSEYRSSPKLNALLNVLLKKFDDVTRCLAQMDYLFDLDNASGDILDIFGALAGVARTVGFQPSGGVSPVLEDGAYRILIKAQIAKNQWDGTIGGLQGVWQSLFPSGTIIIADQQNMTADIIVSGSFTSITRDLIANGLIVPRPQGVLYTFVFAELPVFGADLNNTFIAGADIGHAS